MTGDLSFFSKFRDLQAADYIRKKGELGWFDVEFTMYGCAYLDIQDEKMRYKVSGKAEDIYNFIEQSNRRDVYTSNLESFTQKYPVPSGMKQYIADEIKKELARNLRKKYSIDFFTELFSIAESITTNAAAAFLWQKVDTIEGTFDEKQLRVLENEIHYWYESRKLCRTEYLNLLQWLEDEKKNMDEVVVIRDIQKKTLYGFAYEDVKGIKYVANAKSATIYKKAKELEMQGCAVSPIWNETYWYNYLKSISEISETFKFDLKTIYSKEYFEILRDIKKNSSSVDDKNEYWAKVEYVRVKYGDSAAETLIQYGYRWGIL